VIAVMASVLGFHDEKGGIVQQWKIFGTADK